jgi:hypothetical protein
MVHERAGHRMVGPYKRAYAKRSIGREAKMRILPHPDSQPCGPAQLFGRTNRSAALA